ncbi:hypothetical protein EKO04_009937 [Ascochyta lentis]|uniref:Uncharacterized protein n=1 Tax=Ascochyta lentis TaxID=205686 RepID=A0A8H7MEE3_9PLEO|nr:hypothetical protein EKO04_009937 [Ascochyta lentis]
MYPGRKTRPRTRATSSSQSLSTSIVPSPSVSSQTSQDEDTNNPSPGSDQPASTMTLQQPPSPIPAVRDVSSSLPFSPTASHPDPAEHITSTPSTSVVTSEEQISASSPAGCMHLVHPAYSDTYTHCRSMCPSCRLAACISDATATRRSIMEQGGLQKWLERIQITLTGDEQRRQLALHNFYKGQSKIRINGKVTRCHEGAEGISYPRSITALLSIVTYLQDLSQLEQTWEARNPVNLLPADTQRRLAESRYSSATNALDRYHSYIKENPTKEVEGDCTKSSLKRGREWEILALDNCPDPQDPFERSSYQLNEDQKSFINSHYISDDTTEYDLELEPPKRKRRRLNASVEFDPYVYVRTEADIDLLYNPSTAASPEPQAAAAPRGILRTTPRHMDPRPKRPHDVRHLELRDRGSAKRRGRGRGSLTPGYTRIDTSGYRYRNDWGRWYGYIAALHAEPIEAGDMSMEESTHQVPESGALDEDELRTKADHVALDGQIVSMLAAGPHIRQTPSPERQLHAELARVSSATLVPVIDEPTPPAFSPHGGMVSVFTFGGYIAGGMLSLVRKAGAL